MKPTPKRNRQNYKQIGERELWKSQWDNLFDEITEAFEDMWDEEE